MNPMNNPMNRIESAVDDKVDTIRNIKTIEEREKIRAGRYILGWRNHRYILLLSLIAEGVIALTVVLFTSGPVYSCSLALSIIYLVFKLLTAESKNFITYIKNINTAINEGTYMYGPSLFSLVLKYTHLFLKFESALVLDLVELDISCACRETISFATVDAIILIASINAASRTERVADAIPLLVGFDFIKDFPQKILKRFKFNDHDALSTYEELRSIMNTNPSKIRWYLRFPIICMFHIIGITVLIILFINSGVIVLENSPLSHNYSASNHE